MLQSYDEAAVSWTTAMWAATAIQSRWKGFVARRAFLRDRRMRWLQKRAVSLRLHQDRRWKWMDTKDQVLEKHRKESPKVWLCGVHLVLWPNNSDKRIAAQNCGQARLCALAHSAVQLYTWCNCGMIVISNPEGTAMGLRYTRAQQDLVAPGGTGLRSVLDAEESTA